MEHSSDKTFEIEIHLDVAGSNDPISAEYSVRPSPRRSS